MQGHCRIRNLSSVLVSRLLFFRMFRNLKPKRDNKISDDFLIIPNKIDLNIYICTENEKLLYLLNTIFNIFKYIFFFCYNIILNKK